MSVKNLSTMWVKEEGVSVYAYTDNPYTETPVYKNLFTMHKFNLDYTTVVLKSKLKQ